mgnify:CR=1 FL=1
MVIWMAVFPHCPCYPGGYLLEHAVAVRLLFLANKRPWLWRAQHACSIGNTFGSVCGSLPLSNVVFFPINIFCLGVPDRDDDNVCRNSGCLKSNPNCADTLSKAVFGCMLALLFALPFFLLWFMVWLIPLLPPSLPLCFLLTLTVQDDYYTHTKTRLCILWGQQRGVKGAAFPHLTVVPLCCTHVLTLTLAVSDIPL